MKTLDRSSDKPVGTLEPKVRKTFTCYPLLQIFQIFFKCIFFTKSVLHTCFSVLTFLSKNPLRYKPRKLPPIVRKWVDFFHRKFSHEIFPLACKRQFWQLSRNFYVEFLESFSDFPHVKKTRFFKKLFFMEWSTGHKESRSDQACRKRFAINPKYFRLQSEIQFKKFFSKKRLTMKTILWTSRVQIWQHCQ